MIQKLIITFCIALYALGVPLLVLSEILFSSSDWATHLHTQEAWQLLTNSAIGLFCLWWLWARHEVIRSAIVSLLVTGGFLVAFSTQDLYGGSFAYLKDSETLLFDTHVGVFGFSLAFMLLLAAMIVELIQSIDFDMDSITLPSSALHGLM